MNTSAGASDGGQPPGIRTARTTSDNSDQPPRRQSDGTDADPNRTMIGKETVLDRQPVAAEMPSPRPAAAEPDPRTLPRRSDAADATPTARPDLTDEVRGKNSTAVTLMAESGLLPNASAVTCIGGIEEIKDSEDYFETLNDDSRPGHAPNSGSITKVIGDYQILGELGRGGMGVVYKARHRKLNRVVALKMILAGKHSGNEALQRFISEARAVAHLQHPGIVQIFDIGEHDGLPWFSLEFVDGNDLQRELNGQPRDARSSAELVEKLCTAMQYAHDHRILHRDLKPANILLDAAGQPKITDFGLAKNVDAEGSGATSDGTIMGSPSYMPPEQARGELSSLTPRSDLYSMGAILYQMLTARPPFITDRPLETILQVVNNEPVAPRDLQPGIPVDLETICLKALQKDQAQRYASCTDLAADLRRFLNNEPILARPVSRLERAWRWCRRNPKIAVPSGLAAFFVTATALIASWAWNETSALASSLKDERDTVVKQRDEITGQKAEVEKQKAEAVVQRDEARRQETIANQQTAIALDNEKKAERQALLALRNIQFVVTTIDSQLAKQPGSGPLRIAILEATTKSWEELDNELAGGIKGEAPATLMVLRDKVATIAMTLDNYALAKPELEKNYERGRQRLAIMERNDASRLNQAKTCLRLAEVVERHDADINKSSAYLGEAIELVRDILAHPNPKAGDSGSPKTSEIRECLAAATQNSGRLSMKKGSIAEALVYFKESLAMHQGILDEVRSAPGFSEKSENERDGATAAKQIELDRVAAGLAYCQLRLGNSNEAITNYESVIAARREIAVRRPTMMPLQTELTLHLGLYGQSMLWIDRLDLAEPLIRESLEYAKKVVDYDPTPAESKRALAMAAYRLGTLFDLQGHAEPSLAQFEQSRSIRAELTEANSTESNKTLLMLAEARVGNLEAAERLSDDLGRIEKQNGELHLERARALAQLTRHAQEDKKLQLSEAALTALERAVAEGFQDPFRIQAEPDLRPLHDQDRFRVLIAALQNAAPKPANGGQ